MRRYPLRWLLALSVTGCLAVGCARNPVAIAPEDDNLARGSGQTGKGTPAAEKKTLSARNGEKKSAPTGKSNSGGFPFPDDPGGKLLGELLRPSEAVTASGANISSGPRPLPPPSSIDRPNPPLPLVQAPLPQPQLKLPAPPLWPRSLPEDAPLTAYRAAPIVPQKPYLAGGAAVRIESPDVNQPVPLPILAQPVPDRASLDDATEFASKEAALAAAPPVRSTPTPFLRLSLPDPFELAQTVRLPKAPAEDPSPVASVSRPTNP